MKTRNDRHRPAPGVPRECGTGRRSGSAGSEVRPPDVRDRPHRQADHRRRRHRSFGMERREADRAPLRDLPDRIATSIRARGPRSSSPTTTTTSTWRSARTTRTRPRSAPTCPTATRPSATTSSASSSTPSTTSAAASSSSSIRSACRWTCSRTTSAATRTTPGTRIWDAAGPDQRRMATTWRSPIPFELAALPARRGRADLGLRRAALLSPRPAPPHRQPAAWTATSPATSARFASSTGFAGITPGPQHGGRADGHRGRTDARDDASTARSRTATSRSSRADRRKWGITPNLTLNAAVNPDFSQVEADVAQLDVNTQFALFFPEKRPFFLEGADFFRTPFQAVLHAQRRRSGLGREAHRQGGQERGRRRSPPRTTARTSCSRAASSSFDVARRNESRRRAALPPRPRQGLARWARWSPRRHGDDYSEPTSPASTRSQARRQRDTVRVQFLGRTRYPATPRAGLRAAARHVRARRSFRATAKHAQLVLDRAVRGRRRRVPRGLGLHAAGRLSTEQASRVAAYLVRPTRSRTWNRIRFGGDLGSARMTTSGHLLEQEFEPASMSFRGPCQSFLELGAAADQGFFNGRDFGRAGSYTFIQFRGRAAA